MVAKPLDDILNCWLSPEGDIHEVGHFCHDAYAHDVLGEPVGMLVAKGWLRLSQSEWEPGRRNQLVYEPIRATQRQLDVIFDWCQARHKPLPDIEVVR
jgi:hypothetical protein